MANRARLPAQAFDRIAILEHIHSSGPVSRADLARDLGMRPSSVTDWVRLLIAKGILAEVGQGGSNGGRPPVLLDVDRANNYTVGVTAEPRGLLAALVRWDGSVLARAQRQLSASSESAALQREALSAAEEVLAAADVPRGRVRGVGVGLSALVDPVANEAIFSSTFTSARNLRLDAMAERLALPVYLEDIAYLMALGERWFVYPNEQRPLVFLLIASGACGAVIEPWASPGASRFAAEFGHMVLDVNGPLCGCGKRGCLEAFVSEPAILATAARLLSAGGNGPATLADIVALAKAGNPVAERIIASVAQHLGVATANLANVFAPALIVLGGAVIDAWGEQLVGGVRAVVKEHLIEYLLPGVDIVGSKLGPDAPLMGSAARVMQAFFAAPQADGTRAQSEAVPSLGAALDVAYLHRPLPVSPTGPG